jgi:hypothetical protein
MSYTHHLEQMRQHPRDVSMTWDIDPTVRRRPCNGDFAAQRAVEVLGLMAPYPFDGRSTLDASEPRFHVFEMPGGLHGIWDFECPLSSTEAISTSLLYDEEFNLPAWYADRRAFRNDTILSDSHPWLSSPLMGDVLELGALCTIWEGIDEYPLFGSERRREHSWLIEQSPFGYTIVGVHLGSATCI